MSSIERMMERLAQQDSESKTSSDSEVLQAPLQASEAEEVVQKESELDEVNYNGVVNEQHGAKTPLELQLNRLVESGYLPEDYESSCQFNEFRRIKRPILKNAFSREGSKDGLPTNLVLISSAVPGEGKTFCAINLTLNMILERDITVMLMDVDCIRRSLSKMFGVEESPGLIDVLEGESNVEDVIINTAISQLKIFPAGRAHKHSAELLAGERMKRLSAEIAERYSDRIVLMDAPPFLAANDAEILSQYTGQAVIVVEAEKTSQLLIQQALKCVDTTKTITGLVLNKRQGGALSENGSYGYYESYSVVDEPKMG